MGSIKGRYLYVAGILILLLALAATAGRLYVEWTTRDTIDKIQGRSLVSDSLDGVTQQLARVEKRLERFILQPRDGGRRNLEQALDLMGVALMRMREVQWSGEQRSTRTLIQALDGDYQRLRETAVMLIEIRLDVNLWFPVSLIMQNELLPENAAFVGAINVIIEELEQEGGAATSSAAYRTAVQLRHYWNRMTSEFRLYVANRLGVFSLDPMDGMAARAANIHMYAAGVGSLLQRLGSQRDSGGLNSLPTQQPVGPLRAHYATWIAGYEKVERGIHSSDWRRDIDLLTREIDPLIDHMRQRLSTLTLELEAASTRDITLLTRTAQQLSDIILMLALIGTGLILVGYFVFERSLLRPVADLTRALKSEALGQAHGPLPEVTAGETRDLLQAFHWMRQKVQERQSHLDHLAHHDALTGLPNRLLFRDRLEHALQISQHSHNLVVVLFLDLDRFKQINDTMGHLIGDLLLVEVADRLRRTLRGADTVARFSGDEFAVLMENIKHRNEVTVVVEKVRDALGRPYRLEEQEVEITASIGIALGPLDDRDANALLRNADAAMYEAKRSGRNGFQFFSRNITERALAFLALEQDLRTALERNEFQLLFQPIVSADGARVFGCEALLRSNMEERGAVAPARFISVLEETGMILPVTERTLERVSDMQRTLHQEGHADIVIAVNLSPRLIGSGSFCDNLLAHVQRGAIRPEQLLLEITEDALVRDIAITERELHRLRDQGIRIALDAFGSGPSSINHLRRFPFNMVKIDREFVGNIPRNPHDSILVKAITGLTHSFAMSVTAVGVENAEQLDFVRRNGCDLIQGYHISKPLSGDDFIAFLRRRGGRRAPESRPALARVMPLRAPGRKV